MSFAISQRVHQAFIALGSNLDDPASHVRQAFDELARLPSCRLLTHSALYRTAPVERLDQPDFINAVALIRTAFSPRDLLRSLLEIEHNHRRVRECRNGARTLDLDILLYDDLLCIDTHLTLPHPRMHQRAFVLQPLCEIAPDCRLAGHGTLAELLKECAGQQLERALE